MTKTVLIRCEVPEGAIVSSKELHVSTNGYVLDAEIIEPPTDAEIEKHAFNVSGVFDNHFMKGVYWTLKRLGL